MKKIKLSILILTMLFIQTLNIKALDKNSPVYSDMTYTQCVEYQDAAKHTSGSGYFGHCIKATCYSGVWETFYYISGNMVTCNNGNTDHYVEYVKTGCGNYMGTCAATTRARYCNLITYYDCDRKANGTSFSPTTTKPNVLIPPTTIRPTTRLPQVTSPTTSTQKPSTSETTTEALSNKNSIEKLSIEKVDIKFKKNVYEYTVTLDKEITSLKFNIKLEDEKASYEIENNDPIDRSKPIKIIVKAEDESTKEYKVFVKDMKDPLNNNSKLAAIIIEGHSINFTSDTLKYTLKLEEEVKTLNIKIETENEKTTYHILGNENLRNRSKIKIVAKAEDESTTTYIINIKKDTNTTSIIIISLVVLIALFVLVKLIKKITTKKAKESNYEYE